MCACMYMGLGGYVCVCVWRGGEECVGVKGVGVVGGACRAILTDYRPGGCWVGEELDVWVCSYTGSAERENRNIS